MGFDEGSLILVNYTANVKDTGDIVETTIEKEAKARGVHDPVKSYEPQLISVGEGWVLQGFDDALKSSNVGEKISLELSPEKGFGERDSSKVQMIPIKKFGEGAGKAVDLQFIEQTARRIKENSQSNKIIVEKSTLPVRAAATLENILHSGNEKVRFEILSNPEFMAEGTAVRDMEFPDRVLIGSKETPTGLAARQELIDLYLHWVPKENLITTNLWSSELSKLVSNGFLAQRISSINSIAVLCEVTEADVTEVSKAVGKDSRIGAKFLNAGPGFGGSCFRKDILNLVYLCEHYQLNEVASFWEQVVSLNDYQMEHYVRRILQAMFNTLAGKKLAVFGFAFKPNTGDTRDSPAIYICKRLLEEKAYLRITDPQALKNARNDLQDLENLEFVEDPYKAAEGVHGIALITDWEEYCKLDFQKIFDKMEKPAFIFDGRNQLNRLALFDIGFNIYSVGKAPLTHF